MRRKTNAESVADYQKKTETIRLRFPSKDECGVDYAKLIRERALELGYVNKKGKDAGTGSANAYILHLIEEDLKSCDKLADMSDIDKD